MGSIRRALFPRGILLLDFEEHLHHRRIMQLAFTRTRLEAYLQAMMPTIDSEISRWDTGAGFHMYPAIKKLTLDLLTQFFVGNSLDPEADRVRDALVRILNAGRTRCVSMSRAGGGRAD